MSGLTVAVIGGGRWARALAGFLLHNQRRSQDRITRVLHYRPPRELVRAQEDNRSYADAAQTDIPAAAGEVPDVSAVDSAQQAERRADTLCFDIATSRWFTEATAAQAHVLAHASRVAIPTTWLVGGADPITDPARSRQVADLVRGATYHDLAGMKHEVFNEVERARVLDLMTAALDRAAPPPR